MKIAFTSSGPHMDSLIDPRFGRAEFIVLYNDETKEMEILDNTAIKDVAHGAGTATAQKVFDLNPDVLITGNGPGENAAKALKQLNMRIFIQAHDMTLSEALEQFEKGKLTEI